MTWHTLQCLDRFIKILFLIFVKLTLALTTKSKDLESMYVAQRNLLCTSVLPKASSPIARSLLSQTHFFCSKKTTKTKPERLSLCFQVPVVFFRNIHASSAILCDGRMSGLCGEVMPIQALRPLQRGSDTQRPPGVPEAYPES